MTDETPTDPGRTIYQLNRNLRASYKRLTGLDYPGKIEDDLGADAEELLHRLMGAVIAAVNRVRSHRDDAAGK